MDAGLAYLMLHQIERAAYEQQWGRESAIRQRARRRPRRRLWHRRELAPLEAQLCS